MSARVLAAVAACLTLVACGGGGGDDAPSKQEYYGSIDGFCRDVKSAGNRVQADAAKLQRQAPTDAQAAITGFAPTLRTFADATRRAAGRLDRAGAPDELADFNARVVRAFEGVATKLGQAADGARTGKVSALTRLGTDLGAVKLPELPRDVRANARTCADITP